VYDGPARGWLSATVSGAGEHRRVQVAVSPERASLGRNGATVYVTSAGALNPRQGFRVEMEVSTDPPATGELVVDNEDPGFYATPYYWITPRFRHDPHKGFGGSWATSGPRPGSRQFARFTPDLAAGRYDVWLHEATPMPPGQQVFVVVHDTLGDHRRVVRAEQRYVGQYVFPEGSNGHVDVFGPNDRSSPTITADAVVFRRVRQR
jgi:hypothetical protein